MRLLPFLTMAAIATLVSASPTNVTTTNKDEPFDLLEEIREALDHKGADEPTVPEPVRRLAPQCFRGTQFPYRKHWLPFSELWDINAPILLNEKHLTFSEMGELRDTVLSYEKKHFLNANLLLALILRESGGDPRIPCSRSGNACGLMQVRGAEGMMCDKRPCKNIAKQIKCGALGGCDGQRGSDLHRCLQDYGKKGYGGALRCFDSGNVPNWRDFTKTNSYDDSRSFVQDVGNILLGAKPDKVREIARKCRLT